MIIEVYDLECLANLFTYTGFDANKHEWYQFVIGAGRNDLDKLVEHLRRDKQLIQVGFNNEKYDYPLEHNLLRHYEEYRYMTYQEVAQALYAKSQEIIDMEFSAIADKNKYIQQIDLFLIWHYNNKARLTSLKDLEIQMRMENIEEMPIHHTHWCNSNDIPLILSYNKNDVEATYKFLLTTLGKTDYSLYKGKNKIELRRNIQKKFRIPCLNYPDVKIGEQLILTLYSNRTGIPLYELKQRGGTPRAKIELKDCIPHWANFESKEFNNLKTQFENAVITNMKGEFSYSVNFHGSVIDYGTGGAHSSLQGIFTADDEWMIGDYDIGSLYPSIAIQLKMYPEHLGPIFLEIYDGEIVSVRLAEKKKPKKERDMVIMEGYKLGANGIYGKSGEATSPLYDPLYTMKTTIGGQMFLSLWTEKLAKASPDCKFLQHNTDGITVLFRRKDLNKVHAVNDEMTKLTGLYIEENIYKKMILRDVNNYIAVYDDYDPITAPDHVKLKGCFEIDKEYHKDPSMRIVPKALKNYFVDGIPVEKTIQECTDIYDFCLRLKTNAKSNPKFRHFDKNWNIVDDPLDRTTRYYVSKNGGALLKDFTKEDADDEHGTVNNSKINGVNVGYVVTLFNRYVKKEMKDYNINYNFYIREANKIKNAVDDGQLSLF